MAERVGNRNELRLVTLASRLYQSTSNEAPVGGGTEQTGQVINGGAAARSANPASSPVTAGLRSEPRDPAQRAAAALRPGGPVRYVAVERDPALRSPVPSGQEAKSFAPDACDDVARWFCGGHRGALPRPVVRAVETCRGALTPAADELALLRIRRRGR
jgi:hypothetical protein